MKRTADQNVKITRKFETFEQQAYFESWLDYIKEERKKHHEQTLIKIKKQGLLNSLIDEEQKKQNILKTK